MPIFIPASRTNDLLANNIGKESKLRYPHLYVSSSSREGSSNILESG